MLHVHKGPEQPWISGAVGAGAIDDGGGGGPLAVENVLGPPVSGCVWLVARSGGHYIRPSFLGLVDEFRSRAPARGFRGSSSIIIELAKDCERLGPEMNPSLTTNQHRSRPLLS